MSDVVERIMRYESGDMEQDEIISFFQELVDSGLLTQLQGSYHRMAASLAAAGRIRLEKGQ